MAERGLAVVERRDVGTGNQRHADSKRNLEERQGREVVRIHEQAVSDAQEHGPGHESSPAAEQICEVPGGQLTEHDREPEKRLEFKDLGDVQTTIPEQRHRNRHDDHEDLEERHDADRDQVALQTLSLLR